MPPTTSEQMTMLTGMPRMIRVADVSSYDSRSLTCCMRVYGGETKHVCHKRCTVVLIYWWSNIMLKNRAVVYVNVAHTVHYLCSTSYY